jgi:hypothetical protein
VQPVLNCIHYSCNSLYVQSRPFYRQRCPCGLFELAFEDGTSPASFRTWMLCNRPSPRKRGNNDAIHSLQHHHSGPRSIPSRRAFWCPKSRGRAYVLMEAMPCHRIYGGGFSGFIPNRYKSKVYDQLTTLESVSPNWHSSHG